MKNFITRFQHVLSVFFHAHLTEKLPGVNYEGKQFDDTLSKSILAHFAGRFTVAIFFLIITGGLSNPDGYPLLSWVVMWFFTDIFGAMLGAVIIPSKSRDKYARGCWLPLIGILTVCFFEKYDTTKLAQ